MGKKRDFRRLSKNNTGDVFDASNMLTYVTVFAHNRFVDNFSFFSFILSRRFESFFHLLIMCGDFGFGFGFGFDFDFLYDHWRRRSLFGRLYIKKVRKIILRKLGIFTKLEFLILPFSLSSESLNTLILFLFFPSISTFLVFFGHSGRGSDLLCFSGIVFRSSVVTLLATGNAFFSFSDFLAASILTVISFSFPFPHSSFGFDFFEETALLKKFAIVPPLVLLPTAFFSCKFCKKY